MLPALILQYFSPSVWTKINLFVHLFCLCLSVLGDDVSSFLILSTDLYKEKGNSKHMHMKSANEPPCVTNQGYV